MPKKKKNLTYFRVKDDGTVIMKYSNGVTYIKPNLPRINNLDSQDWELQSWNRYKS